MISDKAAERLWGILQKWSGTPFARNSCAPGRRGGVDCRFFVAGVYDELHGVSDPLPRRTATRVSNSTVEMGDEMERELLVRYPFVGAVDPLACPIEPGDVVVCRQPGRPGAHDRIQHLLLAGLQPGEMWHAIPTSGVCFTGLGAFRDRILRVYRSNRRDQW